MENVVAAKKSLESSTFKLKGKTYSDQTGKFPHMSSRGNQYVVVLYDYDSNAIILEPLKSSQGKEIAAAFTTAFGRLTKHGHEVKVHVLDNECSENFKASLHKSKG